MRRRCIASAAASALERNPCAERSAVYRRTFRGHALAFRRARAAVDTVRDAVAIAIAKAIVTLFLPSTRHARTQFLRRWRAGRCSTKIENAFVNAHGEDDVLGAAVIDDRYAARPGCFVRSIATTTLRRFCTAHYVSRAFFREAAVVDAFEVYARERAWACVTVANRSGHTLPPIGEHKNLGIVRSCRANAPRDHHERRQDSALHQSPGHVSTRARHAEHTP